MTAGGGWAGHVYVHLPPPFEHGVKEHGPSAQKRNQSKGKAEAHLERAAPVEPQSGEPGTNQSNARHSVPEFGHKEDHLIVPLAPINGRGDGIPEERIHWRHFSLRLSPLSESHSPPW